MLKMIDIITEGTIVTGYVLIEGDSERKYLLSVNIEPEYCETVKSEIPDDYSMYERQARVALARYRDENGTIPSEIKSMWY